VNTNLERVVKAFENKYLKGKGSLESEQILGFVVLDSELGVMAVSTYDSEHSS